MIIINVKAQLVKCYPRLTPYTLKLLHTSQIDLKSAHYIKYILNKAAIRKVNLLFFYMVAQAAVAILLNDVFLTPPIIELFY